MIRWLVMTGLVAFGAGAAGQAARPAPAAVNPVRTILRKADAASIEKSPAIYESALALARKHRNRAEMLAVAQAAQSRAEAGQGFVYDMPENPAAARAL